MEKKTLVDKIISLADEIAHDIYDVILSFPKKEQFGLGSQLRRAILSVPTNIIEGHSRKTSKQDFLHFLKIAYGSLAEAKYLWRFGWKRSYIEDETYQVQEQKMEKLSKMLWSLIKSVENSSTVNR